MASNNYTQANVVPSSDTFREWVDLTNRITYDMEKVVVTTVANTQGACTSGNAYVNGFFSANTILVDKKLQGVASNATHYGTRAPAANLIISSNVVFIANSTANAIIHAQSNVHLTGSLLQSNATLNDFNSNVDIDNALTDIAATKINLSGTSANITSTTFTIDGTTLDLNSNVDLDAANVNIDATKFDLTGTTANLHSTTTTIKGTTLDVDSNVDIDSASVTIDGGTLAVGSILDQNANVDIDNDLTDITSTTTNISGTTATIDSTTLNIHGTSLDVNSNTNIDGDITTTANATIGNANSDLLTVTANAVFSDKIKVTKDADLDAALNVDGDVTLNANLVIGSNNSDGANIQSLIVSSIEPSANGKVLGHADRRWAASLTTANTSGDITAGADVDITGEVNAASAAIVGAATVGTTLGVTGVGTFGNDVDITGEVNAATAAIVGGATVGGDITLSGDLDGANNKEANVFNAVVRNDLTVSTNTALNGNTTIAHNKDFIVGNSTIKTLQSNQSGNVRSMVIGQATGANDRIVIQSSVGNSTVGFIPLQGNNVTLGNTTNRWHNASFTNANTSGTFVSTGDITGGADVDITGEANTATLRVRSTSAMGGKLTISSGGASITGSLDTVNNANVGGNAAVTGVLAVTGAATLSNTITVTGAADFNNTGDFAGNVNFQDSITVADNSTFSKTLGAGNTTVTGFANVTSSLMVAGATTLLGDVDLGDAATDTVSFVADVDSNILPNANGLNLGAASARWDLIGATINTSGDITAGADVDITGEVNAASGAIVGDLSVGDDITMANTGNVIFSNTGLTGVSQTKLSANLISVEHLSVVGSAILPNNTTLTASTLGTANLTVTDTAKFTGSVAGDNYLQIGNGSDIVFINAASGTFKSSIIAADDNSYDVGNTTTGAFRSGYFDTSVTVGNTVANTTALLADFVYAKQDLIANFSSDQILKEDILKINTAIDKVDSLSGYEFTWNDLIGDERAGTKDYGVIAQEIENVLPHAVNINSRGYKTVNYNSLIPLLIEAVKELSARVKELENPEEEIDG